jgi:solute carrier family 25 protein 33/36
LLINLAKQITLSPVEYLTVASAAKLLASLMTYPHEVVRTRMREQRGITNLKYTGFLQCVKTIMREEGWRALYGGMGAHLVRVVPNAAIIFLTYETVVALLNGGS